MALEKLLCTIFFLSSFASLFCQQTQIHYLSGRDKDNTEAWDFYCTKGRNSGKWTKINVPSHWEQQGFGSYNYGQDKVKADEQGLYKHSFTASNAWRNKQVILFFEGVMTDTEVKVNGKPAGDIHQGGFYQFSYNISSLLNYGSTNILEVTVSKKSANASVNNAERTSDFWVFGGIYRPVYLKIVPAAYIDRVAIDATANGNFGINVFSENVKNTQLIEVQIQELNGTVVGKPFSVKASYSSVLSAKSAGIKSWNPEKPYLYNAVVSIKENGKPVHTIKQRFGFRTAELRPKDGFYVNDVKVILKGVNRHSFWPESGRTLSREIHLMDIKLMKEMNMNAVRMSHYPPDPEFLDLCDSLGLFVLDELTGWQQAYDTLAGRKLVKELVVRDVNHPSVVMWANGNEGGWNRALDNNFHLYDPQKRLVYHPWEKFNGTDTKHYPDYIYVTNSVLYGNEVYFPTEFMHGLYDGGHGAALEDFWNSMLKHPYFAGGFLWSLSDEGIARTDKDGLIDTDGNHAPDGIVGPYREKEGSYYTIKEIWSPVVVHTTKIPAQFNGKISIENRYLYTNLDKCRFNWKLIAFPKTTESVTTQTSLKSGIATSSLAPGEKGWLQLKLPSIAADALYLTAIDPKGNEIYTWTWALKTPSLIATKATAVPVTSAIKVEDGEEVLNITNDNISYQFDKASGYLTKVFNGKQEIALNGPALAGVKVNFENFKHYKQGNAYIVESVYKSGNAFNAKWIFQPGQLAKLEYQYSIRGEADYMGISFQYPEEKVTGVKWLGRGPYRVWKNRLKGNELGVWQKAYNNTVTGESWKYPEFKGWHANTYWVQLQSQDAHFTVYTETDNLFLGLYKPAKPKGATTDNTYPPFPDGISFMHTISPIGTKFQRAEVMGPQSQKNTQLNYTPYSGTLWFDFRKK